MTRAHTTLRGLAAGLALAVAAPLLAAADTVVYRANAQLNFKTDLYRVVEPGLEATPVFGIPPEFGSGVTAAYQLDRRGRSAYAVIDTLEGRELWEADLASGETRRLSLPLLGGGDVEDFVVGPRGRWIAYRCSLQTEMPVELFLVDLKTGISFAVGLPPVLGGEVQRMRFGPKGRQLVYQARQDDLANEQLFRVDLKTFATILVSSPLLPGAQMQDWVITPDGRSVLFVGPNDETQAGRLLRGDLATGAVEVLQTPFGASGDSDAFVLGRRGRYAYIDGNPGSVQSEVYRIELKTNTVTTLSAPIASGEAKGWTLAQVDPRGRFVIVQGDGAQTGKQELWHVELKTLTRTRLSPPSPDISQDVTGPVRLGPRGRWVYYHMQDSSGAQRLLRTSLKTFAFESLGTPLDADESVLAYAVQPRGRGVAYVSDEQVLARDELWYHDFKTGEVTRLSQEPLPGSDVLADSIAWDRAGRVIRYLGDHAVDQQFELWEAALESGDVSQVNAPLASGMDVHDFAVPGS